MAQTGSHLTGDESNQTKMLSGYALLNLDTSYKLTRRLTLFGNITNLTNQRYYVYGAFSPVGEVYAAEAPDYSDPRSYSIGAPLSVTAGMKLDF